MCNNATFTLGRSKSKSPSDEIRLRDRQATASGSGRGFAFSQEEGGCVSQSELVKKYENRGSATSTSTRYDPDLYGPNQQPELDSRNNTNNQTKILGM